MVITIIIAIVDERATKCISHVLTPLIGYSLIARPDLCTQILLQSTLDHNEKIRKRINNNFLCF